MSGETELSQPMVGTSVEDRIVIITGGTGGIGQQSAISIARTGARVMITGRNPESGEIARQNVAEQSGNSKIDFVKGDVSSLAGVDALAQALLERVAAYGGKINVLVNNAGYMGDELKKSKEGIEMNFMVNVLAVYRLTHAVLPALRAALPDARVVNVTGGDAPAPVDVDNLQCEKGFKGLMTYQHAKSINEAMSVALSRELEVDKVTVNVVFPGRATTAMTSQLSAKHLPGPMKLCLPCFKCLFRSDGGASAAKASQSTVMAVTSPQLAGVTGKYYDTNSKETQMHATAYDEKVHTRILAVIQGAKLA